MNKGSRLVLAIFMLLMVNLSGCVSTTPFKKAEPVKGNALLYVFRPESLLSRGTILAVNINGEKRGLLVNNAYLPLHATPGNIEITLLTNDFIKNKYDSMTLRETKAGDIYFIKAEPGVFGAFTLIKLDREKGIAEISSTEYYATR